MAANGDMNAMSKMPALVPALGVADGVAASMFDALALGLALPDWLALGVPVTEALGVSVNIMIKGTDFNASLSRRW